MRMNSVKNTNISIRGLHLRLKIARNLCLNKLVQNIQQRLRTMQVMWTYLTLSLISVSDVLILPFPGINVIRGNISSSTIEIDHRAYVPAQADLNGNERLQAGNPLDIGVSLVAACLLIFLINKAVLKCCTFELMCPIFYHQAEWNNIGTHPF